VSGWPSDWIRAVCVATPSLDTQGRFSKVTPGAFEYDWCIGPNGNDINFAFYVTDEAMSRDVQGIKSSTYNGGQLSFAAVRTELNPTVQEATTYMLIASFDASELAPLQQYGIDIRHN
jgi:hypothetical protein